MLWVEAGSGDAPASAQRRRDWETWQRDERVPALRAVQGVAHGVRFALAEGFELPGDAGGSHVTVLETAAPGDEVVAAKAASETATAARGSETITPYRRVSAYGETDGRRMGGVVAVLTDCSDPASEDAFNVWYEEHARYVIEELGHFTVTRYVNADPASDRARYLAIYETESDDPGQVQRDGWKRYFEQESPEEHATPETLVLRGEVALEPLD